MIKHLAPRVSAFALAAVALGVVQAGPAKADTSAADVTSFTTKNLSVSTMGCKYIPVTMNVTADGDPNNEMLDTTTHIFRGGTEVDEDWFNPNVGDTWLWCDALDGFGKFKLGPTDVHISYFDGYTPDVVATDYTVGYVTVRQASRSAVPTVSKAGKYVTLTSHATYFHDDFGSFSGWNRVRTYFQYRLPGSSTWHTSTSAVANSTGHATVRVYEASARYWRAVTHDGTAVWGATSGSTTKH